MWFLIESVHFFLGFVGCLFFPDIVINAYTLFPMVRTREQTYEIIRVMAMFYFSFMLLSMFSFISTDVCEIDILFSSTLVIFYYGLFFIDIHNIIKRGYEANKSRYLDTLIHIIFGTINLIYFCYYV
jgi:hypothetical protein